MFKTQVEPYQFLGTTPKIEDLVEDVYELLESKQTPDNFEKLVQEFGENCKGFLRKAFQSRSTPTPTTVLRMSSIGKGKRQLWYEAYKPELAEILKGKTYLKFLYGDILEALLIVLTKMSGHEVTHEQQEVNVEGIIGHTDCNIDGVVTDIKSASPYSFTKFVKQELEEEGKDPFGYHLQISGYSVALDNDKTAFLAINKVTGDLCVSPITPLPKSEVIAHIKDLKEVLKNTENPPEEKCYQPVQEPNGNEYLSVNCSYCPFKEICWAESNEGKGLRVFTYYNGPKFFTKIVKEPRVQEKSKFEKIEKE